jgi:hypothetical protein
MEPAQDQAQIEVATGKGYILVKPPPGIDFWTILTTIGQLIPLEELTYKNDIWVFQEGAITLTLPDLRVIKDFGVNHYPKGDGHRKTAIVVGTHFQSSLAESYIKTGAEHHREIRLFMEFEVAEEWVKLD